MKVLGINAARSNDGLTASLLKTALAGVGEDVETEIINLNEFDLRAESVGEEAELDVLKQKLAQSDCWVFAAPTYWGGCPGSLKQFFDCLRGWLVRIDHHGGMHPSEATVKDKHYAVISSCFTSPVENFFSGVTDSTFRQIDRVMSAAGVIKVGELVLPGTWGMNSIPAKKQEEAVKLGRKIATRKRKDDQTMKRYLELFLMVAVIVLVTFGLQTLVEHLVGGFNFWTRYLSFVVIFYALLAAILHFFTVVKHRRR